MNSNNLPIACALTDKELQIRRETVLRQIAAYLIESEELENGFRYLFPAKDRVLLDLANVINLERKCCPFLNFKLVAESQSKNIVLELTGKTGTREILKALFNWN
jgi:hypothetical protein